MAPPYAAFFFAFMVVSTSATLRAMILGMLVVELLWRAAHQGTLPVPTEARALVEAVEARGHLVATEDKSRVPHVHLRRVLIAVHALPAIVNDDEPRRHAGTSELGDALPDAGGSTVR